jgi:TM2 domain-containing membrane protein YozV
MNYPPNGPPPGGYGGPPPGGYGPPPGGYGPPPPAPGMYGQPMGGMGMMQPHAPFGVDPMTGMPFSDKSKMVAGLLQIFLGSFGAGRFYTGHMGLAIAQIAVTWLTCGVGAIWPLIDGIMMLTGKVPDAQGRPLRD